MLSLPDGSAKAYVLSFTEAIAEEVAGSALRIRCLSPGATSTEFAGVAGMTRSRLFQGRTMDAAEVARSGYEGWKRGEVLVIPGLRNRLGALSVRLAPRATVRKIARRVNSLE